MLARPLPYSKSKPSILVKLFTQRLGVDEDCADEAMARLVAGLRDRSIRTSLEAQLDGLLIKRRIRETRVVRGLLLDGYIEPVGSTFHDGFRMVLKGGSPQTRSRFTIAHELCHTFFYEIVPELKFGSEEADREEERLCNLGAAELLIPSRSLMGNAKKIQVSMASLDELARRYIVSPEAMLLRLRSLKLWNCELSFWRPTQTGFSLDRVVGGRRANWVWSDDAPLRRAWRTNQTVSGRTYVELRGSEGTLQLRSVFFQLGKRGNSIVALWSAKPIEEAPRNPSLF
jgi:Zn-dependent peptidase ImmA (M78 family)